MAISDNGEMSADRAQRARKLLGHLSSPAVLPFIDRERLVKSAALLDMIDMAVDHAIGNGDTGYVNNLIHVFSGSAHQRTLCSWFCSRLGLKTVAKNGRQRLLKDASAQIAWQPLHTVFRSAAEDRDRMQAVQDYEAKLASLPVVVRSDKKRSADLLDSPLRLPGSFEGGRRR